MDNKEIEIESEPPSIVHIITEEEIKSKDSAIQSEYRESKIELINDFIKSARLEEESYVFIRNSRLHYDAEVVRWGTLDDIVKEINGQKCYKSQLVRHYGVNGILIQFADRVTPRNILVDFGFLLVTIVFLLFAYIMVAMIYYIMTYHQTFSMDDRVIMSIIIVVLFGLDIAAGGFLHERILIQYHLNKLNNFIIINKN